MDPNLGLSLSSEHKILLTEFEEITYLGLSDLILNLDEQMP